MPRYFYTLRPPYYGHQPDGFTQQEGGMPKQDWPTADGDKINAFGWVEYPQPLTFEQIWKWDLWPDDPTEAAHLHFWQQADHDPEYARDMEQDHIGFLTAQPDDYRRLYSPQMVNLVQRLADEMAAAADVETDPPTNP